MSPAFVRSRGLIFLLGAALSVVGLGPTAGCLLFAVEAPDAGSAEPDAGPDPSDGGRLNDAGQPDDGGFPDAGGPGDGGDPEDGGEAEDGGEPEDGGPTDGGGPDPLDAGEPEPPDAGEPEPGFNATTTLDAVFVGEAIDVVITGDGITDYAAEDGIGLTMMTFSVDDSGMTATYLVESAGFVGTNNIGVDRLISTRVRLRRSGSNDVINPSVSFRIDDERGPYVDLALADSTAPCGHPRKPCHRLVDAVEGLNTRRDEEQGVFRWAPNLRVAAAAAPITIDTLTTNGMGIRGGFTPTSDGADWVQAASTALELSAGSSVTISAGTEASVDRLLFERVTLKGFVPNTGGVVYSALIVEGNVRMLESSVAVAGDGVPVATLSRPIAAVLVKAGGDLVVEPTGTVHGAEGTFLELADFVDGDVAVSAVRSEGRLNFQGVAVGAEEITGVVVENANPAIVVGIHVTGEVTTFSGSAEGGVAPRLAGVLVTGGELVTEPTAIARGGTSLLARYDSGGADGFVNRGRDAAGLVVTGGIVNALNGTYVGGQAADSVAGAVVEVAAGVVFSVSSAKVSSHSRELPVDALPEVGRGLFVSSTVVNGVAGLDGLTVDVEGSRIATGVRLSSSGGRELSVSGTVAANVAVRNPVGTSVARGFVVADFRTSFNGSVTAVVQGVADTDVIGLENKGDYTGALVVNLGSLGPGGLPNTAVGVACGDPRSNPGTVAFGDDSNLTLTSSDIRVSSQVDSTGVVVFARCTADLSVPQITVDANTLATGLRVRTGNVGLTGGTVTARANGDATALELKCWGTSLLNAAGTSFIVEPLDAALFHAIGVNLVDRGGADPSCILIDADLGDVVVTASDATALSAGILSDVTSEMKLRVVNATIVTGAAPASSGFPGSSLGISLDVTGASVWIGQSEISAQSVDGNAEATLLTAGVHLRSTAFPNEVQLWNNFISVEGNGDRASTALWIDDARNSSASVTDQIRIVHNTLQSGVGLNASAVRTTRSKDVFGGAPDVALLVGNQLLARAAAIGLVEYCIDDGSPTQGRFATTPLGANNISVEASASAAVWFASETECTPAPQNPPTRYSGTTFTSVAVNSDGCPSPAGAAVVSMDAALPLFSTAFPSDYVYVDLFGQSRVDPGRIGPCQ